MSFGFSVLDIVSCAQFVWQVYDALKAGPAQCQAFAKEVMLLHQVLTKVAENLRETNRYLSPEEHDALRHNLFDFENFCAVITDKNPSKVQCWVQGHRWPSSALDAPYDTINGGMLKMPTDLKSIRERIRTASFARKIPMLQRSVTAQIEKLTAFNVLLIQSSQCRIQESQERAESSQRRVESAQGRLEESQTRIEVQLRQILESRGRRRTPLLSNSLDASSPEGRQTWMNLGWTLRKEGITPGVIQKNQSLLIRAMKDTLDRTDSLANSIDESYKTAHEYHSFSQRDSTPLLGSAPSSIANSPSEFLQRQTPDSLDHEDNIASGIDSLLEGMSGDSFTALGPGNDFTETDELTDAEVASMMHLMKGTALLPRQSRLHSGASFDLVEVPRGVW